MCFAPQRRALFRHFFDIWTSKSGPNMVCFVHFDLEMCFAPQRRALFRHRNFQKWSDIGVFCTFWLPNVLRATTACTFSTSQLPKVVRHLVCFVHFDFQMCFAPQRRALFRHLNFQKWSEWCVLYILTSKCASRHNGVHFFDISTSKSGPSWCVLYILTWKCASRHNGVHFFISHLASWLRTRRFSEPTFRPSGAPNHWKNTVFRDFPTFSRICIFFLLILSLLTLLTSAFQLSILSEVSLLNFLSLFHPQRWQMVLPALREWCALTAFHGIGMAALELSGLEEARPAYLPACLAELTKNGSISSVTTLCSHGMLTLPVAIANRRKFRSQTSDNMDRWKAEQGRGREKRKIRRKKSRRERVRRKKMQMREKVGKSRNTVFFQWFVAPEGRKVGSLKRRVRSQLARWEMNCGTKHISKSKCTKHTRCGPLLAVEMSKKCTPLWRETHFEVNMYKTHQLRTIFTSWDVKKVHAVVARSTFRSQNVQSTRGFGPFLLVEMSKKCTPLWREAHFEVKMYKAHQVRTTFGSWDVEKVHAVVARSTFGSQNVKITRGSDHFWKFRCRKSARRCGAKLIWKSKC